jgi:two-component system phosphate regulon sensor histidine kinase PhoR
VNDKNVRTKFLKKAAKSLDGLDILVQDLLTLSHIETGQIKMHFESFDLRKLVDEVFEQFEEKADKKGVKLKLDSSSGKVIVFADWQRINQVMTNLISNAIKHSHEGSEVSVAFEVSKKSVLTMIRDTGEGIPAEHVARIFERFYRVDKARSRELGGTGLGLSIVKHLVQALQGGIQAASELGKGSVFTVRLQRRTA